MWFHDRDKITASGPLSKYQMKSFLLLVVLVDLQFDKVNAESSAKQHLDQGNKLLAAGQLSEALMHYNQAVDADPDNYFSRYRRATCLLALGKSKAALPDLNQVVKLKPDFWQARQELAGVHLKMGKFDQAIKGYESIKTQSAEARQKLSSVKQTRQYLENAKYYVKQGKYDNAIHSLDRIKEICPWSIDLRRLRADCFESMQDLQQAINELKPLIQLSPDTSPETYLRLSKLYYLLPDVGFSLDQIRECLKIDPDHKACMSFYQTIKKLDKQINMARKQYGAKEYEASIAKIEKAFQTTENHEKLMTPPSQQLLSDLHFHKCKVYADWDKHKEALDSCSHAIKNSEDTVNIHIKKADIYEKLEDWDNVIRELNNANHADGGHRRDLNERIEKAQKMKKRAKSRDYYKILEVGKRAKDKEIKKAYKSKAIIYHPDRCGQNEQTKDWTAEKCEEEFRNIADAKEVLTDPEKRKMFDQGVDPLDAEEKMEEDRKNSNPFGGGFPFGGFRQQHGGFRQGGGGGGGGFKFHFGGGF